MRSRFKVLLVTGMLMVVSVAQGALTDNLVALYHLDSNLIDSADADVGTRCAMASYPNRLAWW